MIQNNLKHWLDQKGITPYRLHKEAKIHKTTALKLYRDPFYIPRPEVMDKIAEVYGIQPGWYIFYVPNNAPKVLKESA